MRCSDCSAEIKPVVAVDIDGTLADYHGHFLKFAEDYLDQYSPYGYQGKEPFRNWFCRTYECSVDTFRDIKLAYRQGAQKRNAPVYPYAATLCEMIRREGAELWIATTRPYLRLDNVDPDTRFWLERHDIVYDHMIYDDHKYERLAELVDRKRVVAVVDDLPECIEEARRCFHWTVPIWRKNHYNSEELSSLVAIGQQVIDQIRKWKEKKA